MTVGNQRKVITVVGATGTQGSSVTLSLLQNPDFEVRCVTRNISSAKAQELKNLGAVLVEANGLDARQMTEAFTGSWGAFINTNSEDPHLLEIGKTDVDLGGNIMRSAAAAKVQHIVYSSGPSPTKITKGELAIPGLDHKAEVEAIGRSLESFQTFTPVIVSWFLENYLDLMYAEIFGGFPLKKDDEGFLTYRIPLWGGREDVPWISVTDDLGDIVHGIFLNPTRWNGRLVQANADIASFGDVVRKFVKVTGRKARYIPYVSADDFPTNGVHFLEQLRDMFKFIQYRDGEYFCTGITEVRSAAELKKSAFNAKGGKGRENLMSVEEWFKVKFAPSNEMGLKA
ncbi:NAD(P)-binding protein [Penicillium pulvis]|uniref:NAD(P)-binding protein n=1 Tax=Penicillium pulvis TaxID=1562058 RepID=UPI0025480C92|nr:NAD(P)-binding protein [Penicillium pulvis]KAJ5801840.1 NAD(P)-binding protein [Penicillium pulvis]